MSLVDLVLTFRPRRAARNLEAPFKKFPEGVYGEIKYDGERIQIHKQKDTFRCYSRNLKQVLSWKVEAVEEFIPQSTKAKSVIFDGEILLMDNKTHKPLPFGYVIRSLQQASV